MPDDEAAREPQAHQGRQAQQGRQYGGLGADERRADQHRRLVRAAIDEFAARGFHKASIDDIVRGARTSRSSFYEFWANREECMLAALGESVDAMLGSIRRELFSSPPDARLLDVGVEAYARFLAEHPSEARVILFESAGASPDVDRLRSETRLALAELLRAVWAESDPEAAAAPTATALAVGLVGILSESMLHLIETDSLDEAPAHVARICEVLRRIFAPGTPPTSVPARSGAFEVLRTIAAGETPGTASETLRRAGRG